VPLAGARIVRLSIVRDITLRISGRGARFGIVFSCL